MKCQFLLELYPGKKIGLIIDMCSAHNTDAVKAFIVENRYQLVVGYIDGGLTLMIQVCDLVENNDLKRLIVEVY